MICIPNQALNIRSISCKGSNRACPNASLCSDKKFRGRTCKEGFFPTAFDDHGAVNCERDCFIDNYSCAHCPKGCSCPSGYKVDFHLIQYLLYVEHQLGFFFQKENDQCVDIDECMEQGSNIACPKLDNSCKNTPGSYECICTDSTWYKMESGDCKKEEIMNYES